MGSKAGMPCSTCPHPTCPHSVVANGVTPCPNCDTGAGGGAGGGVGGANSGGVVVLDPVSAPRWRLDCNRCNFLIYLPPNLHNVKVLAKEKCEVGLRTSYQCAAARSW